MLQKAKSVSTSAGEAARRFSATSWALGEQSVRTLRCSKMEDVIFNGTPQRKALGFAEVTLTIDNRDRGLPFDNDTVAVTRRYYR